MKYDEAIGYLAWGDAIDWEDDYELTGDDLDALEAAWRADDRADARALVASAATSRKASAGSKRAPRKTKS